MHAWLHVEVALSMYLCILRCHFPMHGYWGSIFSMHGSILRCQFPMHCCMSKWYACLYLEWNRLVGNTISLHTIWWVFLRKNNRNGEDLYVDESFIMPWSRGHVKWKKWGWLMYLYSFNTQHPRSFHVMHRNSGSLMSILS